MALKKRYKGKYQRGGTTPDPRNVADFYLGKPEVSYKPTRFDSNYKQGTSETGNNMVRNVLTYFTGAGFNKNERPESQYRPSKETDPSAKYYTYPYLKNDVMQDLTDGSYSEKINWQQQNFKKENPAYIPLEIKDKTFDEYYNYLSNSPKKMAPHSGSSINLGHYQLAPGKDETGRYLSVYDKYDWNLLEQMGIEGNSWEIYDRIYEDEWNKIKPKKQMGGDMKSILGYSKNSPYQNDPFIDIFTPRGLIDMSNTPKDLIGIDNKGNKKKMKAFSKNPYKFEGDIVREMPARNPYQMGGISNDQLYSYLFDDDEEEEIIQPEEPMEIEDEDKAPSLLKNERLLQQRVESDLAMEQAELSFENPYRRKPDMFGNALFDEEEEDLPTSYTGQISSGKWGNQNIGQYGQKIIGEVTNALGYTPQFNSIFRDAKQQQQLVKQGIGAKNSYHLTGDAVDMKPADWNNLPQEKKMYFRANYDVVYHNNHYHIEPK